MEESVWFTAKMQEDYRTFIKEQSQQRETFFVNEILPKLNWWHKLLFRINKKLIKGVACQISKGTLWGVMLYGKQYWMQQ